MASLSTSAPATSKVVAAFAIVYIVWGSTYFFIRLAVAHIPPGIVGCLRFLTAGGLMLGWCLARGEKIFVWSTMRPAIISGVLLLFLGNGGLIWTEQYLPSSLAAIMLAAGPLWFVLLDTRKWKENFRSRATIGGVLVGFAGVILLFGESLLHSLSGSAGSAGGGGVNGQSAAAHWQLIGMGILLLSSVFWTAGSLYSKYNSTGGSNAVNSGWQMFAAGVAFIPASWSTGEFAHFDVHAVTMTSWLSIIYLVTMGSLAGYTAFTWLLQVRSATQVSTHAYVNPVVAVLLGVFFAGERLSLFQLVGLAIILFSVLLINLAKYKGTVATPARDKKVSVAESEKSVVFKSSRAPSH